MKAKFTYITMLSLLLVSLTFVPIGREVEVYRAVLSPTSLKIGEHVVTRQADDAVSTTDFLIQDGKLYLKFQSVRSSLLMVTYVTDVKWNQERVKTIRNEHPELEALWDKGTSGVYWVTN
ncbi:hypothetical protein HPT27_16900 [Permianibacter sp. IMCC34836]|uniref:hypothetical protein n=1 Tax=Permianibacter fluminis TaxID=2738515 RepID=UPI0015570425|nr:hypothetical protein [Permianibacter fluminis]NQD38704.1 hypothetical protein [Permianibacter fluminis]